MIVRVWNALSWIVAAALIGSLLGAINGGLPSMAAVAVPVVASIGITWLGVGQFVLVVVALFGAAWLMNKYYDQVTSE